MERVKKKCREGQKWREKGRRKKTKKGRGERRKKRRAERKGETECEQREGIGDRGRDRERHTDRETEGVSN